MVSKEESRYTGGLGYDQSKTEANIATMYWYSDGLKSIFALFLALISISHGFAFQIIPGLDGNHTLSPPAIGDILISELKCSACHTGLATPAHSIKDAPDLSDVGGRVSTEFLLKYLQSPSTAHPGTTMPDVLASQSEQDRREIATALTHFLVDQSKTIFVADEEQPGDPDALQKQGNSLFHSVGCVACHLPREAATEDYRKKVDEEEQEEDEPVSEPEEKKKSTNGKNLEHVGAKYSDKSLSEFLFQPLKVRPSGRMPDMKLSQEESQAIAGYLRAQGGTKPKGMKPDPSLVARGKEYFAKFNCAACHKLDGTTPPSMASNLEKADTSKGCISNKNGAHPRYQLSDEHTKAIVASLTQKREEKSDTDAIRSTLVAFNCIACHVRDDFGGVAEDRNAYFGTKQRDLGEDGRLPPPLTLVGAKLRPEWLKKVLFDGESVRPYMSTRMPQYGASNLHALPELVARVDKLEGKDLRIPNPESDNENERELEKKLRPAGRELLGNLGLNCISCHNFNGKAAPTNQGMDLMTTYQRLQPRWFNQFVRKPAAFRPRIVMPYSWPDGIAAHKTILDGDTDLQIEAIWYYLSLGTSAADPPGIRPIETKLLATDEVRTYRGRSSVAGFRGIAIGYPEKLNYAFNAETGTLSAIWRGEFIRVDRNGQGSGSFNPASPFIQLSQDVSLIEPLDDQTPWPAKPVMTKEKPVNPDPLYPKNRGYQFQGYSLGARMAPTFRYRSGEVDIEDRCSVVTIDDKPSLQRSLHFHGRKNEARWFRVLTGEVAQTSDLQFKTDRIKLTIPSCEYELRPVSEDGKGLDLILKLNIPEGDSSIELTYELIDR